MGVISFLRGHTIEYFEGHWYYVDTGELTDNERPCIRCGQLPTPEGYDACLGYLYNVEYACCGHGVAEPYEVKRHENH